MWEGMGGRGGRGVGCERGGSEEERMDERRDERL